MTGPQTRWFEATTYKAKYEFMARVEGTYKGTPFVGSIGNDTLVSPDEGPIYIIHLDLPMRVGDRVINILKCRHRDVKGLKRRDKWV